MLLLLAALMLHLALVPIPLQPFGVSQIIAIKTLQLLILCAQRCQPNKPLKEKEKDNTYPQ